MTKVKMCGMRSDSDIEYANAVCPEYVGFVFARDSKRFVTYEQAHTLKRHLSAGIKSVGVFVNEDVSRVARACNNGTIDVVQLHGDEDDEYVERLHRLSDCSIIQAYRINDIHDVEEAVGSRADMILLDGGAGDGRSFDWSMIREVAREFFLAGGLNIGNIDEAMSTVKPYGVDVSSGIEMDGHKNLAMMAEFMRHVRENDILNNKI